MEAWPSNSETTFALTPSLRSSVAQVCRRSWKRRSSRTPDRSQRSEGSLLLAALSWQPPPNSSGKPGDAVVPRPLTHYPEPDLRGVAAGYLEEPSAIHAKPFELRAPLLP